MIMKQLSNHLNYFLLKNVPDVVTVLNDNNDKLSDECTFLKLELKFCLLKLIDFN